MESVNDDRMQNYERMFCLLEADRTLLIRVWQYIRGYLLD